MAATWRTDTGLVRKQNEDAAWFDQQKGIFAVADGMGGHLAGEVASRMAIEAVQKMAQEEDAPSIAALKKTVEDVHAAIFAHAQANPACAGMGTTLSMLWCAQGHVYIAHVGDSRIYRLRGGELDQITQDHSLVEELVRAGLITREQARTHSRRNIITRALGTQGENTPDLLVTDLCDGDLFLLCTDGLNSMISDEMIKETLRSLPIGQAADALIASALEAGGRDNVTLILFAVKEA